MQTFFIAPTDFGVGLTSINLGLLRTLERAPEDDVLAELSGRVELQAQLFGGPKDPKVLGSPTSLETYQPT